MTRFSNKSVLLLLMALGFSLLIAACGGVAVPAPSVDQEGDVQAAVEATLTAVAHEAEAEGSPAAEETPIPAEGPAEAEPVAAVDDAPPTAAPEQIQAPSIVLPATVTDFNPASRPLATLGDPGAPVVMYEWSDYT